jgi:hypothetical protein
MKCLADSARRCRPSLGELYAIQTILFRSLTLSGRPALEKNTAYVVLGTRAIVIKAPSLGIKIEKDEYGWRQYFQVTWWQGNLDAAASIRFLKERERVTSLFRDFKAKQAKLGLKGDIGCEADEVWLGRHLRAEEMADLEPIMRGLLADWIRLWSAVGGLKQAGKPGKKEAR